MDRSSVASAVGGVLRAACQSEMTTPSKPHSSLSTSRSRAAVLGHAGAVDPVVGGHDQQASRPRVRRPRTAPGTARAARARRSARRRSSAAVSVSLATKCLTVAATPALLHARARSDGQPGGQHRVLGEELEAAAAERRAHQVDGRREQHVDALAAGLGAEGGGQLPDEPGSQVAPSADGHGRLVDGLRSSLVPAAHAGRAVRGDHRPQADRGGALGPPAVRAGQQQRPCLRAAGPAGPGQRRARRRPAEPAVGSGRRHPPGRDPAGRARPS